MRWILLLCLTWSAVCPAAAQPDAQQKQRSDPIAENLFRPELMLKNAAEVGLSEEQQEAIRSASQRSKAQFSQLQRSLQSEVAALAALLRQTNPDEQTVMDQLDKVLAAEREIKRAQLSLTLAIKKMLSPEQQSRALALRRAPPADERGSPASRPS